MARKIFQRDAAMQVNNRHSNIYIQLVYEIKNRAFG
jgi:hypothetical protein